MRKAMFTVSLVIALGLALAPLGARQTSGEKLEITAFAVNMSNIGTGASAVVEINIDRWSTPAGARASDHDDGREESRTSC